MEEGSDTAAPAALAFCEGPIRFQWAPSEATVGLGAFPDDYYTAPDSATATGLRVKVDADNAPFVSNVPENFALVYAQLGTLDGFGTTAALFLRFDGPVGELPSGPDTSIASEALRLIELAPDGPRRVPYESKVVDDGDGGTVLVRPSPSASASGSVRGTWLSRAPTSS